MANKLKLGLVLAVAGVAGIAGAASDIKSVSLAKTSSGGYQVVVQGTGLTKPRVFRTAQNTAFIVEFDGNLRTSKGKIDVNSAGIKYVQYGWFSAKPPRVRVMLKVDPTVEPKVTQLGANWTIEVAGKVQAKTATTATTSAVKTATTTKSDDGLIVPKLPYPTDALPIPGEGNKVEIHHTAPANVPTPAQTGTESVPTTQTKAEDTLPKVTTTTVTNTQKALPKPAPSAPMVSLDFVGTDIIQILKALSIQSSVNIVASPEVSPTDKPTKLTVSLHGVTLDDALSYVTAISGMRYGRVGNTFIVTTVENFSEAMRAVMERSGSKYVTRVISLKSGEAAKIREATIHALPQTGNNGFYEIIVPVGNQVPNATTTPTSAKGEGEGKQPDPGPKPAPSGRSYYLMIVAGEDRADGLEAYIRGLDNEIINSSSLTSRTGISTVVIPIQSGETGRVKTMIDRLIADHPRASEFSVTESIMEGAVKGEAQTMTLMMIGPEDDIAKLKEFAKTLDKELCAVIGKYYSADTSGLAKEWEVVDVMFVEPTLLELDLRSRFKGLQVSLLPDAVTPNVKGTTTSTTTNQGATGSGGGSGSAADGGQATSTTTETDQHTVTGREPMRLILRGNRGDIEAAKEYIALVDVAPRQIALELRVMELTKEEAVRIGIDWNAIISGNLTHIRVNQGLGDKPDTQGTFGAGDNINQPQNQNWFLATLDSLNSGRNIIARPNALVSDGRSTKLFVGDTVRYIKSIQSTQNGTTVETAEVQVGVVFNIAARLGGNGQIAMNLDQNFSILTGFTPVPGGGNLPQTSDRITNMFVNMESGETVAVGGLTLDQDRKSLNGIPILKDIPILGRLFSREDTKKVRTEIVFFLTARTVDRTNRSNAARPATSGMDSNGKEVAKPKRGPKGG